MARHGTNHKGGRPPGKKNPATIERAAAREQYRQLVLQRLKPLFDHQWSLVRGISYMYRIEERKGGAREHVIVTDPDEIGDILSQMDDGEPGVYNDQYYYITVRPPDNKSIDSMLDRAIDKPTQPLANDENKPFIIQFSPVVAKKNGINPSTKPNS